MKNRLTINGLEPTYGRERLKRNVNYTQNVNGLTDFINFRLLKLKITV